MEVNQLSNSGLGETDEIKALRHNLFGKLEELQDLKEKINYYKSLLSEFSKLEQVKQDLEGLGDGSLKTEITENGPESDFAQGEDENGLSLIETRNEKILSHEQKVRNEESSQNEHYEELLGDLDAPVKQWTETAQVEQVRVTPKKSVSFAMDEDHSTLKWSTVESGDEPVQSHSMSKEARFVYDSVFCVCLCFSDSFIVSKTNFIAAHQI